MCKEYDPDFEDLISGEIDEEVVEKLIEQYDREHKDV